MNSVINTGSFAAALFPGIKTWYGREYDEFPEQWSKIFDKETSRRAFEEDMSISSFGLVNVMPEGQPVQYDSEQQGFLTRYTHTKYGLGFVITKEMVEDDMYDVVGKRRAQGLAFSVRQTWEIICANVLNRAFNSSYVGGDGEELISDAHPNVAGGTQSNRPTVMSQLSEAALEQACIDMSKWTNDRGLRIQVVPKKLIIPYELYFEAMRILKSNLRVGTANNDMNVLGNDGKFSDVVVNNYLTSATAWFVKTDVKNGLKVYERRAPEFTMDNDFDTENAKYKTVFRRSVGWTDWRGVYGSSGS